MSSTQGHTRPLLIGRHGRHLQQTINFPESENLYHPDSYDVVDLEEEEVGSSGANPNYYQYDSSVSSTTYDNRFAITQVDGAFDEMEACWTKRNSSRKRAGGGWSEDGKEEEE